MNRIKEEKVFFPKLYCIHLKECDPKKCSALKLAKFNLVEIVSHFKETPRKAIFLNPISEKELSIQDINAVEKHGIIVIDCSWKNIFEHLHQPIGRPRRLPPLLAANPINYGKWEKLSSAEAFAAALYITGYKKKADIILSKFRWGVEFRKINNLK